jgi:hypothetical protein
MIKIISPEWLQAWLQDRDIANLVAISDPMTLTFGFVEQDKSDGVLFHVSIMRTHPKMYKLYLKLFKKDNFLSPMRRNWVSHAISQNR